MHAPSISPFSRPFFSHLFSAREDLSDRAKKSPLYKAWWEVIQVLLKEEETVKIRNLKGISILFPIFFIFLPNAYWCTKREGQSVNISKCKHCIWLISLDSRSSFMLFLRIHSIFSPPNEETFAIFLAFWKLNKEDLQM